ncbi:MULTISPECIES: ankyrin repeat domain-containing protein, partial [unclassified Streptomyces]|uniref:ankyrin repeat domain-containing protein n=1 Tax=unclassified Streptomyces TaxID=2593676 RepID=UPI00081B2BA2
MNRRTRKRLARRLVIAAGADDVGAVLALLRAGADPDAPDPHGSTPLYTAALGGAPEIVARLLTAGAAPDTESRGEAEGTPLCAAAAWGRADVVRLLLAHGADPDLREDAGTGHSPPRMDPEERPHGGDRSAPHGGGTGGRPPGHDSWLTQRQTRCAAVVSARAAGGGRDFTRRPAGVGRR